MRESWTMPHWPVLTRDQWDIFILRLHVASRDLNNLARECNDPDEARRILAKQTGVDLALSYAHELDRELGTLRRF